MIKKNKQSKVFYNIRNLEKYLKEYFLNNKVNKETKFHRLIPKNQITLFLNYNKVKADLMRPNLIF